MATPNVGILTTTGKALIDKVNSGQAKISFSKVVFSSMDNSQLSDTQIKALTAIAPQEVVVSSPQTTLDTNSGETRIRATGTNEKLADGVYVKTYGVFAKDDTGNEILYGVTVSPNPNYFPAYDGVTPQAVTYSYKTVIQETSNITMTNSNDVYVSQEDLTEAIAKIPQPDLSGYDKTDDVDKKLQNKQDKLDFTAADDSKVVHNSGDETIGGTKTFSNPIKGTIDGITYRYSAPGDDLNTSYMNDSVIYTGGNKEAHAPAGTDGTWAIVRNYNSGTTNGAQSYYDTNHGVLYVRTRSNTSTYTPWVQVADDSKVAHLSGANNFDTVPTVNNNPLLLASSLPSDLARTSQQTNFTAGLQSGGVDVATAADLKSIEDSAWRELTGSNDYLSYRFLYKINPDSKYMDIIIGATVKKDINHDNGNILILDLATIISGISKIDSGFILGNGTNENIASISYTDTRIYMQVLYGRNFSPSDIITLSGENATFAQIYYTELV